MSCPQPGSGLAVLVALFVAALPLAGVAADDGVIISRSRRIPPNVEWTREMFVQQAGRARCTATASGALSVTLLNERAYLAIQADRREDMRSEDVLVSTDAPSGRFERDIDLTMPGSYWFVIGNRSTVEQDIALRCAALDAGREGGRRQGRRRRK